jgi:hypothetical protein
MTYAVIANIILDAIVVAVIVGGLSWAIVTARPSRGSSPERLAVPPAASPRPSAGRTRRPQPGPAGARQRDPRPIPGA